MLGQPINSGFARVFEFHSFSPTWGMLIGFIVLLAAADVVMGMREAGSRFTPGNALKLLPKSFIVSFGATAVCLILSWCLMLSILFIVGLIMKLTGGGEARTDPEGGDFMAMSRRIFVSLLLDRREPAARPGIRGVWISRAAEG